MAVRTDHIFSVMTGRAIGAEVVSVPYTGGSKVIADLAGKSTCSPTAR